MDVRSPEHIFKRYRCIVLAVVVFCVGDVLVHYYKTSVSVRTSRTLFPANSGRIDPSFPQLNLTNVTNVKDRLDRRFKHFQRSCETSSSLVKGAMERVTNSKIYQRYYIKQKRIVVDSAAKLAVCLQAKGGSSFWKYLFQHRKVSSDRKLVHIASLDQMALSSIKFINLSEFSSQAPSLRERGFTLAVFGRNPWDRLVSLYRQKVENKNSTFKAYKYVKAACIGQPFDTFQELLECVLHTWKKGFPDRHWEPLTTHCGLCSIPYHYIGDMPNMNSEAVEVMKSAGLQGDVGSFLQTIRTNSIRTVEQHSVHVDYKTYYRDIPSNIIDELREMYMSDLILLGYSLSP